MANFLIVTFNLIYPVYLQYFTHFFCVEFAKQIMLFLGFILGNIIGCVLGIKIQPFVLESVPVIYGGYDIVSYWQGNRAVEGNSRYALNITSKDNNGIERIYQLQFSSQNNMNLFKGNETKYMFQYGGFCDWGVCCELEPQWPWTANHMGPPGGFNNQMNGWRIYNNKIYIAFDKEYDDKFFRGSNDIENANKRWIQWFGDLNEGILNYMCLSYEKSQYTYCEQHGQPLAPAKDPEKEIYPTLQNPPEWFKNFYGV